MAKLRSFKIRNLETGEVIERTGATAVEILRQDHFCHLGKEPKGWEPPAGATPAKSVKPAKAAKETAE